MSVLGEPWMAELPCAAFSRGATTVPPSTHVFSFCSASACRDDIEEVAQDRDKYLGFRRDRDRFTLSSFAFNPNNSSIRQRSAWTNLNPHFDVVGVSFAASPLAAGVLERYLLRTKITLRSVRCDSV